MHQDNIWLSRCIGEAKRDKHSKTLHKPIPAITPLQENRRGMVVERPSIRHGLGRRLAHCKILTGTGAGQHDCWKRLAMVPSGLASNNPARLRLGLTYVRPISPSYVRNMNGLEQRSRFKHPNTTRNGCKILSDLLGQSFNVAPGKPTIARCSNIIIPCIQYLLCYSPRERPPHGAWTMIIRLATIG